MIRLIRNIKQRGIRLHRLNICLTILAVATSIAMFIAMGFTSSINEETYEMTQQLGQWRTDAYDLQLASDYLTDRIRCFVTTGEKAYLDDYFEEVHVTRRRDRAINELEKNHPDTSAILSLQEAMDESIALMEHEYYAARLTVDAFDLKLSEFPAEIQKVELSNIDNNLMPSEKRELAIYKVFGRDYHINKDSISRHMNNCLRDLSVEIGQKQEDISEKLKTQVFIEHMLTVFIILLLLGIVSLTLKLAVLPLRKAVELIRNEKDLPMNGAFEVRFLAKTYNLMHHTNMKSREKLTYEATHDGLTGLYNRRGYDFLLENVDLETCALILIDLDRFKQINDSFGHDTGDRILKAVATEVFGSFRAQDYICRIGGDELAVIMVHSDPTLETLIRKKVEIINKNLNDIDDNLPPISVSVGVAFGEKNITVDTLFKHADDALYIVKEHGRSGVRFYHENEKHGHDRRSTDRINL
ncbi:MAG: GGDEF domain-containing protein [Eubacterium sp.]|nr:GGDEF domain-containing protein [Eubacterium sp.]